MSQLIKITQLIFMETIKVNAYITECGKKYWSNAGAKNHERNCKCWTNPKHKTCLTCNFFSGNSFDWFHCDKMPNMKTPPTPPHENAPNINANCSQWEGE